MAIASKSPGNGSARTPRYDSDWSALMARAQEGDSAAYRRLLEEMTPYLRHVVTRYQRDPGEAEDVVQDILLTVHAMRRSYDPARPFGPWLVAIARRRIADRLRRQGRLRRNEVAGLETETLAGPQTNMPEDVLDHRDLHAAIETLPEGQRQAVTLLKLEELSLKEASDRTGLSVAALKVATHRAMGSLRRRLGKKGALS
jgi:RNA polymerase sigma-70 factor (ECF subfamily)